MKLKDALRSQCSTCESELNWEIAFKSGVLNYNAICCQKLYVMEFEVNIEEKELIH
jgi:hypothetical protein